MGYSANAPEMFIVPLSGWAVGAATVEVAAGTAVGWAAAVGTAGVAVAGLPQAESASIPTTTRLNNLKNMFFILPPEYRFIL